VIDKNGINELKDYLKKFTVVIKKHCLAQGIKTRCSAIAERPRCRVHCSFG